MSSQGDTTKEINFSKTSHEFRRPLQNIKALVESLIHGAKNNPEMLDKFLNNINYETDRLSKFFDDFIGLSAINSEGFKLKLKNIDLAYKVNEFIKKSEPKIHAKNLKISINIPEDTQIKADEFLFEQTLDNLIDNAIKYNKDAGKVDISYQKNQLSISDTGIGIPKADQAKLFSDFYRASNVGIISGTGLGLSFVKLVCDKHGWDLSIDSIEDQGSSILINFR